MTISLRQQLEEVDYELMQRRALYPRLGRKVRQAELDYHMERMRAVRSTLEHLLAQQEGEAQS